MLAMTALPPQLKNNIPLTQSMHKLTFGPTQLLCHTTLLRRIDGLVVYHILISSIGTIW